MHETACISSCCQSKTVAADGKYLCCLCSGICEMEEFVPRSEVTRLISDLLVSVRAKNSRLTLVDVGAARNRMIKAAKKRGFTITENQ